MKTKEKQHGKALSLTALLLIVTLLMCMTAACAETDPPDESSSAVTEAAASGEITEDKYDEDGFIRDSLPVKTNLDTTVEMLYWSDVYYPEFFAEDTGNQVDTAINRRNSKVEDRLGVTIKYEGTPGNASHRNEYVAKIRTAYGSGNTYDIYAGYTLAMATTATSGFCANMLDHDSLDFTAPW